MSKADEMIEKEVERVEEEKAKKPELPGIGHNSNDDGGDSQRDATAARLKSYIERVERLAEEQAVLAEDVKEVFAEAKSSGFDVKTMRKVIALRKMDEQKRREEHELLELYKSAVGLD